MYIRDDLAYARQVYPLGATTENLISNIRLELQDILCNSKRGNKIFKRIIKKYFRNKISIIEVFSFDWHRYNNSILLNMLNSYSASSIEREASLEEVMQVIISKILKIEKCADLYVGYTIKQYEETPEILVIKDRIKKAREKAEEISINNPEIANILFDLSRHIEEKLYYW